MPGPTNALLHVLLWSAERQGAHATVELDGAFALWRHGGGFRRQLGRLEQHALVESRADPAGKRRWRLSAQGRIAALGGCDPVQRWSRPWDGCWRLVIFDVLEKKHAERARLRQWLKAHRLGYLQKSVYVTPDPLGALLRGWQPSPDDTETLLTLEARPASGESNQAVVDGAWDFAMINARYRAYLDTLRQRPEQALENPGMAMSWRRWALAETHAWLAAAAADPFLPECLWPRGYLGRRTWDVRVQVLGEAADQLRLR